MADRRCRRALWHGFQSGDPGSIAPPTPRGCPGPGRAANHGATPRRTRGFSRSDRAGKSAASACPWPAWHRNRPSGPTAWENCAAASAMCCPTDAGRIADVDPDQPNALLAERLHDRLHQVLQGPGCGESRARRVARCVQRQTTVSFWPYRLLKACRLPAVSGNSASGIVSPTLTTQAARIASLRKTLGIVGGGGGVSTGLGFGAALWPDFAPGCEAVCSLADASDATPESFRSLRFGFCSTCSWQAVPSMARQTANRTTRDRLRSNILCFSLYYRENPTAGTADEMASLRRNRRRTTQSAAHATFRQLVGVQGRSNG